MTHDRTIPNLGVACDHQSKPLPPEEGSSLVTRDSSVPKISRSLRRLFVWYSRRYLVRHFNSLRVARDGIVAIPTGIPVVIYSNHASWWDPLVGLQLAEHLLPGKSVFAPMDAAALVRYGFFKRLGVFGLEQGTRSGAVQFLRTAGEVLRDENSVLWLTPQSRFADARERPVQFKPGIGHLPRLGRELLFVPVAIEYVFWEERLPEILVRYGEPYRTTADVHAVKPARWVEFFADRLRATQEQLAQSAQRRDPAELVSVLRGRAGVGGVYDRWRSFNAKRRGETFQPEHGRL